MRGINNHQKYDFDLHQIEARVKGHNKMLVLGH